VDALLDTKMYDTYTLSIKYRLHFFDCCRTVTRHSALGWLVARSWLRCCRSWRKKIGTKFCTTECRKLQRGQPYTSYFSWRSETTFSLTFWLPFSLRVSRQMWVYYAVTVVRYSS